MDAAPFCGREAELEALDDAWRAVRDGDGPRAVVLLGAVDEALAARGGALQAGGAPSANGGAGEPTES